MTTKTEIIYMEEQNIVSIDLGTSKIGLTIARKDGRTAEVIYYGETPSQGIARGSVQNVRKAAKAISEAIELAEETIHMKITGAVVNMPKYPITRKSSIASMDRDGESCVEEGEIDTLRQNAMDDCSPDDPESEKTLIAIAQSYSDEDTFQMCEEDIVGRTSSRLEGCYDIYIGKKKSLAMIDQAFNEAGRNCGTKLFPALSVSRSCLSEDEMNRGVALVDMGAGATSISVWKGGIMRWYDSIPFGGNLVTKDIQEVCNVSESLAENLKKAYGACLPDRLQNLSDKIIKIMEGNTVSKTLQVKYLSKIITARMIEIVDAALYMIQESGYADKLNSGIVLTGGVSNCCNLKTLVRERSGLNVRIGIPGPMFTCEGICDGISDQEACASVGMMLMARDINYANCTTAMDSGKGDLSKLFDEITPGQEAEAEAKEKTETVQQQKPKTVEKPKAEESPKTENASKSSAKDRDGKKKGRGFEKLLSLFDTITEEEEV